MTHQFAFSPLYVEWLLVYSFFWGKIIFALHFLNNFSHYIPYLNLLGHSGIKSPWEGKNMFKNLYLFLDLGQAVQQILPSHNHSISTKLSSILRFFFGIIKETLLQFSPSFLRSCHYFGVSAGYPLWCVINSFPCQWIPNARVAMDRLFPDRIVWPESYPSNEVRKSVFSLHCVETLHNKLHGLIPVTVPVPPLYSHICPSLILPSEQENSDGSSNSLLKELPPDKHQFPGWMPLLSRTSTL